ncbi:MAG: hypothetical protein K0U89_16800, partial [Planctomycetes bacterium]|nr:hypothetical protein [Planctomycetota bacterium]
FNDWVLLGIHIVLSLAYWGLTFLYLSKRESLSSKLGPFFGFLVCWLSLLLVPFLYIPIIVILAGVIVRDPNEKEKISQLSWRWLFYVIALVIGIGMFVLFIALPSFISY